MVSPDGKLVALTYPDGNTGTPGQTAIFSGIDLKKQMMLINHGPKLTALAFDSKGNIYAATDSASLIRFDADGKRIKDYDLGGKTRQILPSADGTKLLVLTKDKLLKVELP